MRWTAVVIALASAPASAEPPRQTLTFGPAMSTLPTITSRIGFDAALRIVRMRGLTFLPRLGGELAFSAVGGGAVYGAHAGLGAGWTFAPGRWRVTPSAGYDLFLLWDDHASHLVRVHRYAVEAEVGYAVAPRVEIDGFVDLGVAYVDGARDVVIAAGPAIGLSF